jgi:type VI secretion system secreted protein Hcp
MAIDAFIKFSDKDLAGEATHFKHKGEIEILSFSFGASNPSSIGPGRTGSSTGRASLSSFSLTKFTDRASPLLFQKCCAGEHMKECWVTLNKSGGAGKEAEPFLTYHFTGCFIDSIQWQGARAADDSTPVESISIAFTTVWIQYQQQDANSGNVGKPVIGTWNIATDSPS